MNNALLIEKNKYLLMVIVSTYNHECYIEDCLKGIVMQKTTFPFVAVVLDDCSTDGTKEIIQQYESLYPELIKGVYFTENQYSQGKNTMSLLKTHIYKFKYVALCEGDDYWTDPLKLQKQVVLMDNHPECTLCFHNAIEHWEDNSKEDKLFAKTEDREYTGLEIFKKWTIPTASALFRTEVFRSDMFLKIFQNPKIVIQDNVMFLLCSVSGKLFGMSDVMSVYRRNDGSLTNRALVEKKISYEFNRRISEHFCTVKEIFQELIDDEFPKCCDKMFLSYNYNCMKISIFNKDLKKIKETVKQAWQVVGMELGLYYMKRLCKDLYYKFFC